MQPVTPWSSNASFGSDGLSVAGLAATRLAEEYGTPLVVVDEDHFRARCRSFAAGFPRALWAVKAFPLRALMRIALEEGLGLLAATGGEVDACLRAGAPGGSITFHGNNKLDAEIEEAIRTGVGTLIVDNAEEIPRMAEAARAAGITQSVLVRVAPGLDVDTHEYVKTGAPDTKFGIPIAGGMAMTAVRQALDPDALEVRGIHLHVGSQLLDSRPYGAALDIALDFLAEAGRAMGFEARILDVGGGMGTAYTDEAPVDLGALGRELNTRLAKGCANRGLPVPELVVEPGRAVSSGAALTLYRVGTIKDVPDVRTFVAVDGGMSDNIRPALYGARYTLALASRQGAGSSRRVTVVGRHCESGDVLARDVDLPADLGPGDLLAMASTGAYEYAMASTYNRVGRPAVVLVSGGEARLIARREEYEDLARLDVE